MTAIQQLRCVRHPEREAAAKCVSCGNFFCRECFTEHDGRMLCADCLRRDSSKKNAPAKAWHRGPLRFLLGLCSIALLWIVFYGTGRMLLTVPDRFHEGILPHTKKAMP